MTLGSHQRAVGRRDERFTPAWLLAPLGAFETDAATSAARPFDIGVRNLTPADDSLCMDWADFGRTWLNPPFNRFLVGGFVQRMCAHGHGILLLHARTDTAWFRPIWDAATALFFLAGRVVFCRADGAPIAIEDPAARHYGKVANSGAPVVLAAFGHDDAAILAASGHDGAFVPLALPRWMAGCFAGTWREAIERIFPAGEFRLADLYVAFAAHPKARGRRHVREKLRQIVNRGGFERVAPGVYRRAAA